jgi:hypothetical protein
LLSHIGERQFQSCHVIPNLSLFDSLQTVMLGRIHPKCAPVNDGRQNTMTIFDILLRVNPKG